MILPIRDMRTSSMGSGSRRTSYSRTFDLPDDYSSDGVGVGGAMLPIFLNDLGRNNGDELVEVTLELEDDNSYVLRSVTPPGGAEINKPGCASSTGKTLRNKLSHYLKTAPSITSSEVDEQSVGNCPVSERERMRRKAMKMKARLVRDKSSAQRALGGLRFISRNTEESDVDVLWKRVESRFDALAVEDLLSREHFGECIGMADSKEFALGVFDALARRRRQKIEKITKAELHEFWLQISDQSFDARLQIFFDMADSNEDGRITQDEVQELLMLSASANKLSKLKERAEEYACLIMEELDPEGLGYIEIWQLETLLLQKDRYMDYSRQLSIASVNWSQNLGTCKSWNMLNRASSKLKAYILENWQRGWILLLWFITMAALFTWKFLQYRQRSAFQVMGYCLGTAKGAAETLKLNMALILLPVCRNVLTFLRSTRARHFIPLDDNINFHKIIAMAIAIAVMLHAGIHLSCDFPRLINAPPDKFELIASNFSNVKPTYKSLYSSTVVLTGIAMVILMTIAITLATKYFRKNTVKLPSPFNRLTGFNAFWYSHHLFGLVYILLIVHGTFLFLVREWYQKTTWTYIAVPLLLYVAERSLRTCRSEHYSVKILKSSVLPGDVLSLVMSKPNGFKYKSGQYIFLQCPNISSFEWHPFSITSAPGDNYLSVHIRSVGDWTHELKRVFAEDIGSPCIIGRAKFGEHVEQTGLPRLLVDGPYGAPAQDYQNYDVLLLIGLGIGATPFISILRDLLNNTRTEDQMDSNTETSKSEDSLNSFASPGTTFSGKKKSHKTKCAHLYWVTREPGSFEWFKGVMDEVAEIDQKGQIEMHNYLTSVYEEGDARSTLITMVQALNHAKHGVDILSLKLFPAYFEYITAFPADMGRGCLLPSSSRGPGPTAITMPIDDFSLDDSVSSKPPAVFCSASATLIRTISFRGFKSLISSVSRIPTISSSFTIR